MLSQRTLGFLEGLANASNVVYPEGGLLFTFKSAYRQAGSCLSKPLQEALLSQDFAKYAELSTHEVSELARFIQGALGTYTNEEASHDAKTAAVVLIDKLKEDLQFDLIGLSVVDGKYDMTATFEMAHCKTHNYFWLELWWSLD